MLEVRNINKKRVGDISFDKKSFEISLKGCRTIITANPDGTLKIVHQNPKHTA